MNGVKPWRSLRVRLIASVVLVEVVMLSLLVWHNLGVIREAHADRLHDTATSMLQQITATAGSYLVEVDYASLEEYLRNIARHPELAYLVIMDRDGRIALSQGEPPAGPAPLPDVHPLAADDGRYDVQADIVFGGRPMGRVLMGLSLAQMEQAIGDARDRSIAIAGAEIVLSILVTVLIGVHLTRRLGRLARAAQRVGAGDYDTEVPTGPADEVGMTASAFNRMVKEISQRTRRLQEALARERVIEETAIDGMITYGRDTRIRSANPAMPDLFGFDEDRLAGQPASMLLDGDPDPLFWTRPTGRRREARGRRRDGSVFPLEVYVGRVEIHGEPLYAATLHDITERKRAETECKTLLEGNRFLIHKSLAVQEEERRHLARELHDELGQCMTAIQADAELIRETAGRDNPRVAASAGAILDISSRMYDAVHAMMRRLRPTVLDDLGLVAALEEAVGDWRARHPGIACELVTRGHLDDLGESVNISLYRIVQECLTNVARHAQADRVRIELVADEEIRLEVRDNGRGLEPGPPRRRGLGLLGIRERVEALGGRLEIDSAPGKGTCVKVRLPGRDSRQEEETDRD